LRQQQRPRQRKARHKPAPHLEKQRRKQSQGARARLPREEKNLEGRPPKARNPLLLPPLDRKLKRLKQPFRQKRHCLKRAAPQNPKAPKNPKPPNPQPPSPPSVPRPRRSQTLRRRLRKSPRFQMRLRRKRSRKRIHRFRSRPPNRRVRQQSRLPQ